MLNEIIAVLEREKAQYTVHEHEVSRTYADAVEKLAFPPERLLKTVVFRAKPGRWILAALRGEDRVDYRKLSAGLGLKRDEVNRASPEEVLAVLGVEVGAVGPVTPFPNVEVLFDSRVSDSETLFCGIGRPDRTLEIMLRELVRVTGGRVLAFSQDAKEG